MPIATMHDALPIFGFAALALVACAGPPLWAHWVLRGSPWAGRAAAAITAAGAVALVVAGEPLLLIAVALGVGLAALARRHFEPGGRMVAAALIVAGGLPVYAMTLLLGLIGWAAIGCAPDAYECPI